MSKQEKSRKPLIIGIVAAVVILAVLLGLLLTQCAGQNATESTPAQTVGYLGEAEDYDLYWNLDRALYDGKSEAGMSSRKPESDGLFHVRFFIDGEIVELKVADRKTVNAIEVNDLMGLEFNNDGIVVGVISLDDMPLQQVGWKFYVQSVGGNLIKLNSAKTFNGMELLLEMLDDTGLYDMTGAEGEVGKRIIPIATDRVIAIANLEGKLTHMYIYERSEYMQSFEAECQHCKETVTWKVWNKPDKLPTATGHYQLSDNIQLKVQQAIEEDGKVCLDLNGYAVDGVDNGRVYTLHNVGANLALMDTSEEQKGVLRGHSTGSPQGGVVWVRYGAFYMYGGTLDASDMVCTLTGTAVNVPKNAFFYMYGGTIIGGNAKYTYNAETKKYGNGLGGSVSINGKMVMHDGVIRDGYAESAVSAWNADGTPKTYQRGIGGNIYVANGGEFEMHGGKILNGTAGHSGGNVYLDGASTMIMNGGEIAGGQVTGKGRNGGNVFVTSKATLEINGGSINWGTSRNCAGNLYFNGTVVMNGGYIGCGQIRDWATGKLKPTDSRTNVFQVGGSMTMFGGVIDGGYTVTDTSATDQITTTLILGGMPVISGREELEYEDLVITNGGSGVRVIVATLVNGTKIGVNATTGIFTLPTAESNAKGFYSTIDEAQIHYVDGCIALGRWACVCGSQEHFGKCDGTQLFWAPITSGSVPGATGNYFLAKDVTVTTQVQVLENADVKLDLNGHVLTGPNNHRTLSTFNPNSKLTITDTSEGKNGSVKSRGTFSAQGSAVWLRYGSFDFYGGILDGSDYTLINNWNAGTDKIYGTKDDKTEARDGGTVAMATGTTFNMYGGTIIGAKAAYMEAAEKTVTEGEGKEAVKKVVTRNLGSANGGAMSIGKNCVFNMYGGEILDGHSDAKGGNIYMTSTDGVANIYGGLISGGSAGYRDEEGKLITYIDANGKTATRSAGWGGNIDMNDGETLNIYGGTITGGTSGGNGGNIRVGHSKAVLNMSAGVVSNGESTNDQGGNMFFSGTANLTGGTITGGKARNGGNIGINSPKDITMQGVRIENGYAPGDGGNIRMSTTNKTGSLIIAEGTLIIGGEAKNGGNLCVAINNYNKNDPVATLNITGGTLENGLANGGMGGNLYAYTGTFVTMTGGELKEGVSSISPSGGYGGNLYNNGATITISGGILQDGQAGLLAEDGQSLVFGNNDSNKKGWGGNISMKAGTLTITDEAQVLGGTAGRNGGSIHAEGGTLNVAGGTISGGLSTADQGGNIWVGGSKTYLNVTGGTIKDGTTAKNGGNIHCNADVNVSLTGGYITGGSAYGSKTYKNANVNLYASENITIGSVKIDGYVHIASSVKLVDKPVIKGGATNLSVNGFDVDVSGLDVGSDVHMIGITDSAAGIFSGEADLGEEAYFFSDDAEKVVGFVNGKLTLDKGRLGMGRYRCLCGKTPGYEGEHDLGCDGDTTRFWAAWTSTNSLPTENGNWYLTASEIKFTSQFVLEKDAEVAIDLNGCVVTDTDNRMLTTSSANKSGNVTLWITDTSAGRAGKLVVTDANYADKGELLWLETGSTLNLLAGTLDATAVGKAVNGAAILVGGKSTLNIYGGSILGGYADVGGTVSVAANSTLNVYDGTIAGGNSPKGGAIYTNGTVNLQGGSILGGTATEGGAVYVDASGTVNLQGGTIQGGTATTGGAVHVNAGGSVNLTGEDASISGGVAELGGNLYVLGSLTMTDGEIADGKAVRATGGEGGNIRLAETASVTLSGGTISGGKAGRLAADGVTMDYGTNKDNKAGLGGNICLGDTANMAISGDALITLGTCGRNGGNVYIGSGSVTMTGGEVSKGRSVCDQGGNFFNSGDLFITGGTVSEGTAPNGGNIGINSNKHTVLGGDAIVKDGVATSQGGNIRMNSTMTSKCELTIEGNAQITGGHAANGGNIYLNLVNDNSVGSLVMTGGTVADGVVGAKGYGGNIFGNTRSVITISGGTVANGTAGAPKTTTEEAKSGYAGNIHVKGTLELSGTGAIIGGWANNNGGSIHVDGTMTMTGGSITGGFTRDRGGNIFVAKDKTLTVTGGTITGGTAGGTITGGKSEANKGGGNIATNEAAIVSLSNVTIDDPHVDNRQLYRANMEINKNVQLTIGDGTVISGGVGLVSTGTVLNISGKVIIDGGEGCTSNLSLNGNTITLGEMKADSSIGITTTAEGPFTTATDAACEGYFFADAAEKGIAHVAKVTVNSSNASANKDDNRLWLGHYDCECAGAGENGACLGAAGGCTESKVLWMPWTTTNMLPTVSGNWYLTGNVTLGAQVKTNNADQTIRLDLNGKTVSTSANRGIWMSSKNVAITITDSVGGGKIKNSATHDQGGIFWIATAGCQVKLLGGTLDSSEFKNRGYNSAGGSAVVIASSTGSFTMYGGEIRGNHDSDDNIGYRGAAVAVTSSGAVFELHGGTIYGGKVKFQVWDDHNKTASARKSGIYGGYGGAVFVGSGASMKMSGGEIIGGTAIAATATDSFTTTDTKTGGGLGGAVYVAGTLTMEGGMISGGSVVSALDSDSKMVGGKGDNVYVASTGTLNISGGEIVGGVDATEALAVSVSGSAKIAGGTNYNLNLGAKELGVSGLTTGAEFGITADEGAFTGTGLTKADLAYFTADNADQTVSFYNGQLHLGKLACLCGNLNGEHVGYTDPNGNFVGCNGDKIAWTPWTSTTTLPTSTGNFYLTAPVVVTGQQNYSAAGQHVVLDLNGYQVSVNSANSVRIYAVNQNDSSLVITDNYVVPVDNTDATRTGGKLLRSTSYTGEGGVVWLSNASQKFVLIRGELTAPADSKATGVGGLVSCNGDFYMLGGYLHDGKTTNNGGNVCMRSTSTMYLAGGRIINGSANNGGNLDITDTATLIMTGGTVSGGKSGNANEAERSAETVHADVQGRGTLVISGGTIAGNVNVFNWQRVSGASITLSGNAQIGRIHLNKGSNDADVKVEDIQLPTITINGALSNTTPILVTTYYEQDHYFATTTEEANAQRFTTSYEGKAIHYMDGKLYLGKYNCLCGGNGNTDTANGGTCVGATEGCDSQLRVWTATTSLPSTTGNYYLTKDFTLAGNGPTVTTVQDIALDLNGYDIIVKIAADCGGRMYSTNGSKANKVSFLFTNTYRGTDPSRTGLISYDDTTEGVTGGDQGRLVWFTGSDKHVKVYNVDFDLSKIKVRNGGTQNGLIMSANSDNAAGRATMELYNVSVVGGNAAGSLFGAGAYTDVIFHDVSIENHIGGKDYAGVNISQGTANVILSGTTYVTGCKTSGGINSNLRLINGGKLILAENYTGTAGKLSGINSAAGNHLASGADGKAVTYAQKNTFVSDTDTVIGLVDGKLKMHAAGTHIHCICGGTMTDGQVLADGTTHNCQDIIFTPISGDVDGANQIVGVTANWYLADDVQITGTHYRLKNCNINLCLNGHNWNGKKDARAIALQEGTNTMAVTTCQADVLDTDGFPTNNRIVSNGTNSQGLTVWVRYGDLTLYAGHLDGRNSRGSNGANVCIEANRTMTMYGGSVFGGTSRTDNTSNYYGANIYIPSNATLNVVGGKIYAGNAKTKGGNLSIAGGTVNMYGGLITEGKVGGVALHETANVVMSGTGKLNISGGEITGGIAGHDNSTNATVAVSGSAKLTNPSSGSSNGYYRLIINNSGTAGKPCISLVIGQLNDDALIRTTMKKTGDLPFVGQFATAAENYTITESDFKKVTYWWHGGAAISGKYTAVLKDNGLWVQEK